MDIIDLDYNHQYPYGVILVGNLTYLVITLLIMSVTVYVMYKIVMKKPTIPVSPPATMAEQEDTRVPPPPGATVAEQEASATTTTTRGCSHALLSINPKQKRWLYAKTKARG